ncbi:alpha/beta-hydrolase [Fomitiporia mediterranea MF3/22]|uniref:alpha/beta-hydrolase n=1 Tax=Fomitiporia mediterranea (strain MF3/22) TaxID=694068 RepID=UPI000440785D|nr:alpha/beta-hydrolase [Fomitiporia mediterranea MF3/22]EJD05489.1 alpha/beta-hydrolase [Fomitiporia mediterranea MF3/22]
MAIAPSDDSDSAASACFSDSLADTDTDIEVDLPPTSHEPKSTAPMVEQHVSLAHSALQTEFVGVCHRASHDAAEVHQFRGIKYATVPMRFRKSVMHETFSANTDATRNGPICPQIRNHRLETRLYGLPHEIIPEKEVLQEDEFECTNLTITLPAPACKSKDGLLPVMVWIHGGGNVTGCATDWIWDAGALVRRSVQIEKPVIIVSVNFRLGLFGFAASELLREDNTSAGEEGVGNYGLHDQRMALQWIRKYISGFGGDPFKVTLFGSSWGAADIHAHLLSSANQADVFAPPDSEGPLFHRAILQSGALVPSSSVVQDIGSAGHHLGRVMSSLHASTIEQLRAVPASKIVSAQGERVRPVDDGVFLRPDWRTLALPYSTSPDTPRSWRQDVIIGDVACESVLWAAPARLWAADAVARRARAVVQSVRRADALMRAYDIVDGSPTRETAGLHGCALDDDETTSSGSEEDIDELAERVMELMNDVAFAWPVDVSARCAADSAFVYEEHSPPHISADGHLAVDTGYLSTVSESSELSFSSSRSPSPSPLPSPGSSTAASTSKRYPNAPYVYRYVFDQASPYTNSPHHGVDLLYLFGNVPFPEDPELTPEENQEVNWVHIKVREEMQERWLSFAWGQRPWEAPLTPQPPAGVAGMTDRGIFATAMLAPVSSFPGGLAPTPSTTSPASSRASSFSSAFGNANPFALTHLHQHQTQQQQQHHLQHHVQNQHHHHHHHHHHGAAGQLYGSSQPPPISISEADKVFVFGPDGETGARSAAIFAGRRRVHAWRSALAPLGLATAQKVGLELGNGPPSLGSPRGF